MTVEERLDWLCRLRSFLTTVGMPGEWRTNFTQALSDEIKELEYEVTIKKELKDKKIISIKKDQLKKNSFLYNYLQHGMIGQN